MATVGTAYVQIVPSAQGISGSIKNLLGGASASAASESGNIITNTLGTAAKVGIGAIGAASAAVIGFGASSVSAGMSFDSSMSQVAATMGTTVDQIGDLRSFAQEMGATTAFSATQAADALNFMALAGYDAQTSMDMLPNVLNLAAAGGMELATASDMITDSQTALGLSLDETSALVDKMAAASSNTNTSVSQLGDAILTVGGNAKSLSGGTSELTAVLGALADNGIKGAEAGTHLRNIMLAMNPTTDAAVKAWDKLGVSAYDAQGNLRSIPEVFGEISSAMSGMTDQQKTDLLSDMFNKTDLASVNALLATTSDRWTEVYGAIDNASGAAQKMADTQLDNLAGDVTLFKSALEGAQIAVSDALTPALRDFVQFGSEGLSTLTTAFQQGGLSGAMEALGGILAEGVTMLLTMLPQIIAAAGQLLGALVTGLIQNAPMIISAGMEIVTWLVTGLAQNIGGIAQGALQLIGALWDGITAAAPQLLAAGVELISTIVAGIAEGAPQMIAAGTSMLIELGNGLIQGLPTAITTIGTLVVQLADAALQAAPQLLSAGTELVTNLATGLSQNGPAVWTAIGEVLSQLITTIMENLPTILEQGIALVSALAQGLIDNAPEAVAGILEVLTQIITTIVENLPEFLAQGLELVAQIIAGIIEALPDVVSAAGEICSNVIDTVGDIDWASIGGSIIQGIANGISSGIEVIKTAARNAAQAALNAAKSFLGIASPSKEFAWIGRMTDEGYAQGIRKNLGVVDAAMSALTDTTSVGTSMIRASGSNLGTSSGVAAVTDRSLGSLAASIVNGLAGVMGPDNSGGGEVALYLDDEKIGRLLLPSIRRASAANPEVSLA